MPYSTIVYISHYKMLNTLDLIFEMMRAKW
jgi:hypothetical protein